MLNVCPFHTQPLSLLILTFPQSTRSRTPDSAASHRAWLCPFAITPTLLPVSAGLCDTVTATCQQLLSPVLMGTTCHAGQHFDLFQTDRMGCKRRHKTLFHAHRANAFCSFMEREEQKQSLFPVLWLSLRAFGAELLSPALPSSWLGRAVALGRAPSRALHKPLTTPTVGLLGCPVPGHINGLDAPCGSPPTQGIP